ncbi:MAG: hypothetical protein HGA80_05345 [Candidatus Omnitrophica bacterium]|nr:hypothetical protein [Candidatus Omnitrophota bacterium]
MPGPILFAIVAFGPLGFFLVPSVFFLFLIILMAFVQGSFTPQEGQTALLLAGIVLYTVAVAGGAYRWCLEVASWKQRGWIIFLAWIALALPLSYILAAGVGGSSMAVADGGVAPSAYGRAALVATLRSFLMSLVLIVPWTFAAVRLLRYIASRRPPAP